MSENDKPWISKLLEADEAVMQFEGQYLTGAASTYRTLAIELGNSLERANAELAKLRAQAAPSADNQLDPASAFECAWLLAFKDHVNRCRSKEDARFWFLGALEWQRNQQTAQGAIEPNNDDDITPLYDEALAMTREAVKPPTHNDERESE